MISGSYFLISKTKILIIFSAAILLWLAAFLMYSPNKADAFVLSDNGARSLLASQCANNTIHIVYADADTLVQNNNAASVTFVLKGNSYRCPGSSGAAWGVGNTLTAYSSAAVGIPHTFYSGVNLAIGAYAGPTSYGPFTIGGLTPDGCNSFTYSYTVQSFGTSFNTGVSSMQFCTQDVCDNIAGVQYPNPPPGHIFSGPNCVIPNSGPSGSFGATCTNGTITITANASDPDGDQITITSSVTGAGTNPPNYSGAAGNGLSIGSVTRIPDDSTYTVTGTITDSAGNSADMSSANATCSRPAASYTCTANTVPTGPFEVGQRFTIEVSINASSSSPFSTPINDSTHPVSISVSPGMNGVDAASETGYTINPWPGTGTAYDYNIYSDTPDTYNFTITVGGVSCPTSAVIVGLKSYMKIFGGEVTAGGGFGSACAPVRGGIYAWARTDGAPPRYAGASAQLTVTSLLQVNDFYSASNRNGGNTFSPKGITFANDNALNWGGNYGSASCITDYFTSTRDATIDYGNWNGSTTATFNAGRGQYSLSAAAPSTGGARTIANPGTITIPTNRQVAVYQNGNVFIRNNIVFGSAGGSWQSAPNFVLVATGDIFISQNVTRLDGLYISQGGTIYTCVSNVNSLFNSTNIFNNCQNQLRVNGGLIGTDIRWLRLNGTLKDANFQEQPSSYQTAAGTLAGEVINYTPQVWLAPSPLKVPGTPDGEVTTGGGPYDAIKELPPTF